MHRATWPDQQILLGTLGDIRDKVLAVGIRSQSMVLVGRVLTSSDFAESRLYDLSFTHWFRKADSGFRKQAKPMSNNVRTPEGNQSEDRADCEMKPI